MRAAGDPSSAGPCPLGTGGALAGARALASVLSLPLGHASRPPCSPHLIVGEPGC